MEGWATAQYGPPVAPLVAAHPLTATREVGGGGSEDWGFPSIAAERALMYVKILYF
jgi:hypothetical protein